MGVLATIRSWRIGTRLLLAFVGVLLPYLALVGIGLMGFRALEDSVRAIQAEIATELRAAADLQLALVRLVTPANDYLITGDPAGRGDFERLLAEARRALGRLDGMHVEHPEERRVLQAIRQHLPRMEGLSREILAHPDPRRDPALPARMKALDRLADEAAALLGQFRAAAEREVAEEIERNRQRVRQVEGLVSVAVALSVAGGLGLAVLLAVWLGRPLRQIALGSRRMAGGDLSVRVDESAGAELGETARAFNRMAERLARLFDESEGRRRSAEALAQVGQELTRSLDFGVVARQICEGVIGLLGVLQSAVYRLDPESGDLVVTAVAGNLGPSFAPELRFPRGTGAVGLALRERAPVWSANVLEDPRINFTPEVRRAVDQAGVRAVLAVPMLVGGQVVGAVGVGDRAGRVFTEEEVSVAQAFADQAAIALENSRLHRELVTRVRELEEALAQVRRLQGLLPICSWCKKVRRDETYWQSVESYVAEHTDARFTHGICPECRERVRAELKGGGGV
jgi:CHASE3 domain sensor protein